MTRFAPEDRACHGYTLGTAYVGLESRREIENRYGVGADALPVTLINSCDSQAGSVVYPRIFYTDLDGLRLLGSFGEAFPLAVRGVY